MITASEAGDFVGAAGGPEAGDRGGGQVKVLKALKMGTMLHQARSKQLQFITILG